MDNTVVDMETLQALYENVSTYQNFFGLLRTEAMSLWLKIRSLFFVIIVTPFYALIVS